MKSTKTTTMERFPRKFRGRMRWRISGVNGPLVKTRVTNQFRARGGGDAGDGENDSAALWNLHFIFPIRRATIWADGRG